MHTATCSTLLRMCARKHLKQQLLPREFWLQHNLLSVHGSMEEAVHILLKIGPSRLAYLKWPGPVGSFVHVLGLHSFEDFVGSIHSIHMFDCLRPFDHVPGK